MIPLIRPDLTYGEVEGSIQAIVESGILTGGQFVDRFEQQVAEIVGATHAVATTSASTAMTLALVAQGVGPGDEVLVSDFTFPATGNVIAAVGARPVLIDSRPESFVLDIEHARSMVTNRTAALLVVHPFGQPVPFDELDEFTNATGVQCIEDAACALGSTHGSMQCGSGRTGCFSFHPRKVVTTGEGGMVTTNDRTLADHMRRLRSHGGVRSTPAMRFEEIGFNFRLSEIPAALGLAQLSRLDEILSHRREVSHAYELLLREVDGVSLREEPLGQAWSYQSFVVMLDPTLDRDRVIRDMMCRGIETTLGTYAMHAQPAFAPYGYQPGDLPNSFQAQESSLTLPLSPSTTTHEVEQVCDALALAISSQ